MEILNSLPGTPLPLGASVAEGGVNFSVFSRNATKVFLEFYSASEDSEPYAQVEFSPSENRTGDIWHAFVPGIKPGSLYLFRVDGPFEPSKGHRFDVHQRLFDPYAKTITPVSVFYNLPPDYSAPLDKNDIEHGKNQCAKVFPKCVVIDNENFDWQGDKPINRPLSESVIYEVHLKGFTAGKNAGVSCPGTYAGFIEKIPYLKDLGITHVQILPMFDYAQINSDKNYNWGYNPYHYNVPEGRYVTEDYTDGTQAVLEAREMIKAFHDAGIAVIMDVVYNHTSGTLSGSLYDSTVPGYFYRQSADGSYSNGSGVGNETASDRVMVQKYMIDSLKHWVNDYHINGFRFDLMGVHDKDTMKAIYDELYKIDNSILVYGEPWTGSTSALDSSKSATSAGTGTSGNGYGAFDDDFRDALKGAEFGGFNRGQIQGNYADANLILGLSGETIAKNKRNDTGKTGLALHYVECHDNYTLFDKLVYSMDSTISGDGDWAVKFENLYNSVMKDEDKVNLIKKENKLAAAYVFLSQGTPFINGGQEFMRTKKGSPDSYSADKKGGITWTNTDGNYNIDDVNTINLSLKEKYIDVYNTYKGLIHLRKDYDAFRKPSSATAKTLKSGVTLYEVNGSNGNFAVVFNATNNDESFDKIEGNLVTVDGVDVEPYVVSSQKAQFSSVPAKSFIIIKK